jgi:hypothetical protein
MSCPRNFLPLTLNVRYVAKPQRDFVLAVDLLVISRYACILLYVGLESNGMHRKEPEDSPCIVLPT